MNHFDTRKLTFARQKSTLWIKQKKSNFDIQSFKVIIWLFSAHHTEKRLNADYTLFFKLNWKVFKFVEIKICFYIHVILQLSGCNQFPTRKSKLAISAVHVELVANEYVFWIKLLKHLLVKSSDITKYFRILLCNQQGFSSVEIFVALVLFPLKF